MQKTKKRKQISPSKSQQTTTKTKNNNNNAIEPYPSNQRPTPQECVSIRDDLLQLHGFPLEFAKFRNNRQNPVPNNLVLVDGLKKFESCEENLSVLDGLVTTILSQNTTDVNSQRAFANLKVAFPSWEEVLVAEQKSIEEAIKCGGLAPTKASCIKNVLKRLQEKKGKLCLEYLRDLSINEIKSELSCFKGIGPKTVACVLLFHLQKDDFPVDTHIAKTLGWVPKGADAKKTYIHLNMRIPNELKFDLNCLLFTHGKMCNSCSSKFAKHEKKELIKKPCPLLGYCRNSD